MWCNLQINEKQLIIFFFFSLSLVCFIQTAFHFQVIRCYLSAINLLCSYKVFFYPCWFNVSTYFFNNIWTTITFRYDRVKYNIWWISRLSSFGGFAFLLCWNRNTNSNKSSLIWNNGEIIHLLCTWLDRLRKWFSLCLTNCIDFTNNFLDIMTIGWIFLVLY